MTKQIMQRYLADLVLLDDLTMEGFDVTAFAAEMDTILESLGYSVPHITVADEEVPWRL